ncbi:hypothetical protein MHY85_03195 [Cellulomonas sp. ACRRI]|uniref:hypothetical protein n=1 Tax=Cellulomonas sp. ACRRI TaxID=2918188 RepID=UPI001EF1D4FD|nr:hypothetical protein [Cellulomonas sp. ACRRI]MCG7284978.1 hypothetical protein [Cellulomonas sp. ACRRI]
MEPVSADLKSLRMVVSSVAGATGPEVFGGSKDGSIEPFMVIAQFGVSSVQTAATGTAEEIINLGLTKEQALAIAQQLRAAAALIKE